MATPAPSVTGSEWAARPESNPAGNDLRLVRRLDRILGGLERLSSRGATVIPRSLRRELEGLGIGIGSAPDLIAVVDIVLQLQDEFQVSRPEG